jgi:hypothetical protein
MIVPKKELLEFRKKSQFASFWQLISKYAADIIQKRVDKIM